MHVCVCVHACVCVCTGVAMCVCLPVSDCIHVYVSVCGTYTHTSIINLFLQWLLRLVLLVVVVNAAGVNVFGVLAVDVSTVVVVKGDDSSESSPQTLSSTTAAAIVDNSTSKTFLTTSAPSVSSEPVTTAKSLTALEKLRSDFCVLFSEYEALCKGDHTGHTWIRRTFVLTLSF